MNYEPKIEAEESDQVDTAENPLDTDLEQERASKRRIWFIVGIALAAIVGIWFLLHSGSSEDLAGDAAGQIPVVTAVVPGKTTIAGEINATGTLAARREMPVGSVGEGGEVRSVRVEPGDWVKKGQILAVVDRSVQSQQIQRHLGNFVDMVRPMWLGPM